MFLIRTATFIIQMPCSTTAIFVSLNIRFVNSKSLLKLKSLPNILFSTIGTCYQIDDTATITRQITFNEVFFFFFLSGFSFTDTDNSQDSRGREGTILFHSTTSTRSRTFTHLFATLHVRF